MKKIKLNLILVLSILIIFVCSTNTFADTTSGYEIDSYDVNIVVDENNELDIVENINVFFNEYKHGIIRKIPYKNTVIRLDGSKTKNNVVISSLTVNETYSISNENGYCEIRIGEENNLIIGQKDYRISYSYDLRNDPNPDYDELYFNIIGSEWDTTIDNVTFSITMPKDFDESKIGFSRGTYGTLDSSDISFSVDGRTITGKCNTKLNPHEGLTIRIQLPNDYFVTKKVKIDFITILSMVAPITFVIITFIMWLKYGKDDKAVDVVEFYPPNGLNSLETAFMYKGKVNTNDVVSLLIYLANKGYIKIIENKKNKFIIQKIKEYDGDNMAERMFLNGMFKQNKTQVDKDDLYDSFYVTINKIIMATNTRKNREKIYYTNSLRKGNLSVLLFILITYLLIIIKPASLYSVNFSFFSVLFPYRALSLEPFYLVIFVYGIICIILMIILKALMPKRNQFGNEMLGRIRGFKQFLNLSEKDKLEAMVNDNPTYFYDILPYAYVLGVSNKWISKFETISMEAPDWYDSYTTFNFMRFNRFMNNTMISSYAVSSNNSSSGFSTGGGFSGGGSGGGGGSSW